MAELGAFPVQSRPEGSFPAFGDEPVKSPQRKGFRRMCCFGGDRSVVYPNQQQQRKRKTRKGTGDAVPLLGSVDHEPLDFTKKLVLVH